MNKSIVMCIICSSISSPLLSSQTHAQKANRQIYTNKLSSSHGCLLLSRWVLYEKPNFKGEKVALDEGDIELTCPFHLPEEQQQNGQKSEQNGQTSDEQTKPSRKFIIGSLRRAVRVRKTFLFYVDI